jgi:hypothetical protein
MTMMLWLISQVQKVLVQKSVQEGYCYGNCYDGFSATQNNDKIGLILFSDEIELYIPPKKEGHVLRIIRS